MIHFKCGKCGKKLAAKDESAGKRVKCPACGQVLQAPAAGEAPRAPAAKATPAPAQAPAKPAPPPPAAPRPAEQTAARGAVTGGPARLSKAFYFGSILGAGIVDVIVFAVVVLFVMQDRLGISVGGSEEAAFSGGFFLFFLMVAAGIYGTVVGCLLLYRMWQAIQAGPARTTPGKAVGLLFIPFYNFYWMFQAILGWARDYNAFVAQRGIESPPAPEGLAKTLCILALVGAVPCLAPLALPVVVVLMLVFYAKAIDCVNALALVPEKATAPLAVA